MKYSDLRDFISQLQRMGELKPILAPVSPNLEMTEICDRTLRAAGPALLFQNPTGHSMPVLGNLFGTPRRVALGMGAEDVSELRKIGHVLARLKEPEPPKDFKDLLGLGSLVKAVWDMSPKELRGAPCQEIVWEGADVDLSRLPIQHCWPGDVAPLITWGLVITKGPNKKRQNLGIYRQQVLGPNKVIMRWLAHRGGALDFREHAVQSKGKPYPVCVALGADPATILGAVTPVPDSLSEYSSPACCAAAVPSWSRPSAANCGCRRRPRSCWRGISIRTPSIRAATNTRWKARTAITPVITMSRIPSRCSPSTASPCGAIRFTTPLIPASRRTSRPCWAWR